MRCCGSGCHNSVEQHQSLRHARWVASKGSNRSSHTDASHGCSHGSSFCMPQIHFQSLEMEFNKEKRKRGVGGGKVSEKSESAHTKKRYYVVKESRGGLQVSGHGSGYTSWAKKSLTSRVVLRWSLPRQTDCTDTPRELARSPPGGCQVSGPWGDC